MLKMIYFLRVIERCFVYEREIKDKKKVFKKKIRDGILLLALNATLENRNKISLYLNLNKICIK